MLRQVYCVVFCSIYVSVLIAILCAMLDGPASTLAGEAEP